MNEITSTYILFGKLKIGSEFRMFNDPDNAILIKTGNKTYRTSKSKVTYTLDPKTKVQSMGAKGYKFDESFNIHYPSLKKLVDLQYDDPRTKDSCTIVAEKCGKLRKENGEVIEGSYIMYEDSEMKGKFIAVHVSDAINEESGESEVNVIAIGNKKSVRERMGYRIRRNKNLEEGFKPYLEIQLNNKLNEVKINKQKVQNATEYANNYDFKKSRNFIGMLQGYGISTEPGYEYTIDDAIDNFDEKDKQMFVKDMKKFGFKVT